MNSKNITPHNDKGEPHGYWEYYYSNGKLSSKGNFVNGEQHGYWEYYYYNGQLWAKGKYING